MPETKSIVPTSATRASGADPAQIVSAMTSGIEMIPLMHTITCCTPSYPIPSPALEAGVDLNGEEEERGQGRVVLDAVEEPV